MNGKKLTVRELLEIIPPERVRDWEGREIGKENSIATIIEQHENLLNCEKNSAHRRSALFTASVLTLIVAISFILKYTLSASWLLLAVFVWMCIQFMILLKLDANETKRRLRLKEFSLVLDKFCLEAQVIVDAHCQEELAHINMNSFRGILIINASNLRFSESRYLLIDGQVLQNRHEKVAASQSIDQAKSDFDLLWKSFISFGFLPEGAEESAYKKAIFTEAQAS